VLRKVAVAAAAEAHGSPVRERRAPLVRAVTRSFEDDHVLKDNLKVMYSSKHMIKTLKHIHPTM
jgi:hypothetical protein